LAHGVEYYAKISPDLGERFAAAVQALLHKIITRLMKLLTRRGVLVKEEEGSSYLADADSDDARALWPLQAAACTYCIAFGPRAGQKVFTLQGAMPLDVERAQDLCADQQGNSAACGGPLRRRRAPAAGTGLPHHHVPGTVQ